MVRKELASSVEAVRSGGMIADLCDFNTGMGTIFEVSLRRDSFDTWEEGPGTNTS